MLQMPVCMRPAAVAKVSFFRQASAYLKSMAKQAHPRDAHLSHFSHDFPCRRVPEQNISIVLDIPSACKQPVIRGESKLPNGNIVTLEFEDLPTGPSVPDDDISIPAQLPGSEESARVGHSQGDDSVVMATQAQSWRHSLRGNIFNVTVVRGRHRSCYVLRSATPIYPSIDVAQ